MFRLRWIISFLVLWASLTAEPQVGVCSVPVKNQNIAKTEIHPLKQNTSEKTPQVVIIERKNKKVADSDTAVSEEAPNRINPMRSGKGPLPVVNRVREESQQEKAYYDCDYCCYEQQMECEDYCKSRSNLKKWFVPVVAVGGIIGAGVNAALGDSESNCTIVPSPVGDLTFEFDFNFNSGDAGADIDFEIRLPNNTIFQSFSLGSPTTNVPSNTIADVLAGAQYTVVATDFNATGNLDVTFIMRAYLNGNLFSTQQLDYIGGEPNNPPTPTPPQTFTFTVPSS